MGVTGTRVNISYGFLIRDYLRKQVCEGRWACPQPLDSDHRDHNMQGPLEKLEFNHKETLLSSTRTNSTRGYLAPPYTLCTLMAIPSAA